MRLTIHGKNHFEVSPELKSYAEKKIAKLDSHAAIIHNIDLYFHEEHQQFIAEGQINVPKDKLIVKESNTTSMEGAMDVLIDKLMRQMIRYKEKHGEHR